MIEGVYHQQCNAAVSFRNKIEQAQIQREIYMISKQSSGCKILDFHGGDYEGWHLLECYAVWLL
jgi:hypothetical protein